MNQKEIQEQILAAMLLTVNQWGWSQEVLDQTTCNLGYPAGMSLVVFPEGLDQVLKSINQYFDQQMIKQFQKKHEITLRTHEKIRMMLQIRLEAMQPYYQSLIKISKYYAHPIRFSIMAKCLWKTVDEMWHLVNDKSLDYNYYTKRGLLYRIHSATLIYWMNQNSDDLIPVLDFMDRKFKNISKFSKLKAKITNILSFSKRVKQ